MSSPVTALAGAEGRRLVRNPLVWVSFLPTALWVRAVLGAGDGEDRLFLLVGYGLVQSGFVMVAAVVFATLRGRIERTEELLGTLAVGPDRRSIGHAGSTAALAAIGIAVTVVLLIALRPGDPMGAWDPSDTGVPLDVPRPNVAQLLQGPLALVAVATFAVALVRWVPTWLVLGPMLFLLMVQGLFFGVFHGFPAGGVHWLWPLATGVVNDEWSGCGPEHLACTLAVDGYDRATPWWHVAYLVSVSAWFTTIAVLRHRRDHVIWSWFAATLVVMITVAAIQFSVAEEFVS